MKQARTEGAHAVWVLRPAEQAPVSLIEHTRPQCVVSEFSAIHGIDRGWPMAVGTSTSTVLIFLSPRPGILARSLEEEITRC